MLQMRCNASSAALFLLWANVGAAFFDRFRQRRRPRRCRRLLWPLQSRQRARLFGSRWRASIPDRLLWRLDSNAPAIEVAWLATFRIRRRAPSSSRWERARAADFQVPTSAVGREARSGQGDTDRPEETRSCLQTAKSNKLIQVVFMRAVIDAVSHPPFDCLGVLTLRLSTNRTVPSGRHCQPRGWRTYTRMGMKRLRSGQGRARGLPRGAVPFHVPGVHRTARGALHHRSEVLRLYRGRVPCGTGRRRGPACRLPPS